MEKIRRGNDIEVLWAIYAGEGVNESPYNLEGKNLSLYLNGPLGRSEVYNFEVKQHVIRWMFWGKEQRNLGNYSLELVENEGKEGMHTVDECDAFSLVKRSCETGNDSEGRVECIHLQFRSSMTVGFPAIGAQIEVDDTLSLVSENPVQNKVLTLALQEEEQRAKAAESRLERLIDSYDSRLTLAEQSLELAEDSIQSLSLKIDGFEATLEKIQPEIIIQALTKVEENSEAIQILVSDATVEGSVDNKIATAFDWAEIQ